MAELVRAEVYFSGTVQGVGFRFTTVHLAKGFRVTGSVRNLYDGRVEVIAEGKKIEIRDFIAAIRESSLKNYITDIDISWEEYRRDFTGFNIDY